MNMFFTDQHHELDLCHITIDLMLILMVYVYNFKEFTGETVISQVSILC